MRALACVHAGAGAVGRARAHDFFKSIFSIVCARVRACAAQACRLNVSFRLKNVTFRLEKVSFRLENVSFRLSERLCELLCVLP